MQQVVSLIEETVKRANLTGKKYVLGLLTEKPDGELNQALNANKSIFVGMGVTAIEWKDDGLRGRANIAGEELLVSVQAA